MSDKMKNIYIAFLTLVCFVVIFFIGVIDVCAFETIQPNSSTTYNGTTYYKYNLPTRYADGESTGMSVRSFYYNAYNSNSIILSKQDNITLIPIMNNFEYTDTNVYSTYMHGLNSMQGMLNQGGKKAVYGNFNFYMGTPGNNSDMLSSGAYFNYANYYDFEFEIIGFSNYENMRLPGKVFNQQWYASSGGNSDVLHIYNDANNNNDFGYCQVYDFGYGNTSDINIGETEFSHYNYVKYVCQRAKFDTTGISLDLNSFDNDSPYVGKIQATNTGFMFSACNDSNISNGCHNEKYKYIISQPYNIKVWSTSESLYTQDTIMSQHDIDSYNNNFARQLSDNYDSNSFITQLFDLDFLGDFSIQSLLNTFKNFFQTIFSNSNTNSCNQLSLNIYNKQIIIPCGYNFWSRTDIQSFRITWELIFNCLISVFVIRAIFNEIINIFNPNMLGLQSEVLRL